MQIRFMGFYSMPSRPGHDLSPKCLGIPQAAAPQVLKAGLPTQTDGRPLKADRLNAALAAATVYSKLDKRASPPGWICATRPLTVSILNTQSSMFAFSLTASGISPADFYAECVPITPR
jgi:hypothetical protein